MPPLQVIVLLPAEEESPKTVCTTVVEAGLIRNSRITSGATIKELEKPTRAHCIAGIALVGEDRVICRRFIVKARSETADDVAVLVGEHNHQARLGCAGKERAVKTLVIGGQISIDDILQDTGVIHDALAAEGECGCTNGPAGVDRVTTRSGIKDDAAHLHIGGECHHILVRYIERRSVSGTVGHGARSPVSCCVPVAIGWVEIPGGAAGESELIYHDEKTADYKCGYCSFHRWS